MTTDKLTANILAMYLGQDVQVFTQYPDGIVDAGYSGQLLGISSTGFVDVGIGGTISKSIEEVKLILRPLSSMTEEEAKELEATKSLQRPSPVHHLAMMVWTAESFKWALSKGFDLFGLIEKGLAITKEK